MNKTSDKHYFHVGIVGEISFIENEIIKLRNPIVNTLDHMPKILQWLFRDKIQSITEIKERRKKYIGLLYHMSEKAYKTSCLISNKKLTAFEKMALGNCLITKF